MRSLRLPPSKTGETENQRTKPAEKRALLCEEHGEGAVIWSARPVGAEASLDAGGRSHEILQEANHNWGRELPNESSSLQFLRAMESDG